jgi:PKD repeat protein
MEPGIYNVSLRVFDDEGSSDINTTKVIIVQPNRPPSEPAVTGPENGTENTTYEFEVVSTDDDNDSIQYTFDWGDGTSGTSEFLPSGTTFKATHKWAEPGTYSVTVTADDNKTIATEEFTIEIEEPEPIKHDLDETNILFVLLPLLALLILLLLLLDKRRRDKKKKKQEKKPKPKK